MNNVKPHLPKNKASKSGNVGPLSSCLVTYDEDFSDLFGGNKLVLNFDFSL